MFHDYGLEELISSKYPQYIKQFTDPMQSLSKYQGHSSQIQKKNVKIHMETQVTLNSKNNLKQQQKKWRQHNTRFQDVIQLQSKHPGTATKTDM